MTDRLIRLHLVLLLGVACLVIRLVDLQVLRGALYRGLAERNRLRLVHEPAPRGLIVDRRGRVLASNERIFRVAIVPQELERFQETLGHVSAVVGRPAETLRREYQLERGLAFVPATIVSRVPKDVAIRLEEDRWRYPGLLIRAETVRAYPRGSSAAHLLGHLSQPTPEELPLLKPYGIRPKHLVGRLGIERLLDHALRGQPGGMMVEVDHRARQVRVIGHRPPEPGVSVTLTIDAELQSLIEQVFGSQAGACVVLDPRTGDILAMAGLPAFSPSDFIGSDPRAVQRWLDDPASPLLNRATVGAYQPGSIIKLVTAAAALEARVVTPETVITCPGSLTIGDRTFHCWNRDGHGPMRLRDALTQSCNVYFMQVGRRVGLARLRAALEQAGFSRRTGWPLEEQAGHLPQRRLSGGEVALLGIGQGEISVTVLQAARLAGLLASRGALAGPRLVQRIGGHPPSGGPARQAVPWSAQTIEVIREGMVAVVQQPGGTGFRASTPVVSIAGKTGTAQTHVPERTHGWFVGFCPVEEPRAAFAILTEYGGSGGDLPAEIARTICEYVSAPDTL